MTAPDSPLIEARRVSKVFVPGDRGGRSRRTKIIALNDISLSVWPGESVGIIGRNGAGKTTLLRALAGTTVINAGQIIRRARPRTILSLTGSFQSQLTGRENIFLYGSLLGLLHRELVPLVSEILHFAGLEEVADEPLRHYSSGMKLRLAFATATVGQPALILLDEVIATGDAEFRGRTLERLQQLRRFGTSFVVTSHDLGNLAALSTRLIWLDEGAIKQVGPVTDVIQAYRAETSR